MGAATTTFDKPTDKKQRLDEFRSLPNALVQNLDDWFRPVRISGSAVVLANPLKVPDLMQSFAKWLESGQGLHPVALAAGARYIGYG